MSLALNESKQVVLHRNASTVTSELVKVLLNLNVKGLIIGGQLPTKRISYSIEVHDKSVYVRFFSSARWHILSVALFDVKILRYWFTDAGYEDVRDFDGQWIRIEIKKGDLIVLPPGMYHRFTLDSAQYLKVGSPLLSTFYFSTFKVCWQPPTSQTIFAVGLDQQLSPLVGNCISSGFSYQVSELELRCKI